MIKAYVMLVKIILIFSGKLVILLYRNADVGEQKTIVAHDSKAV